MHRVKAKVEAEKDKKQTVAGHKRAAPDDKSSISGRPPQRRRSSQKGSSGSNALPPSPTAISPLTTSHPMLSTTAATGSPTSTFTPVGVNGTRSFTPQSGSGSSPSGTELIYPFAMGQGIYTPFGNSPPLFPVAGQNSHVQLPPEMMGDMTREDDGTGQFWQSLFGPPGSSIPPPSFGAGFPQPAFTNATANSTSPPGRATGAEFRDPNDVNIDMGGDNTAGGVNLDDIDNGLVDWGDFIAQCSQVWVTE